MSESVVLKRVMLEASRLGLRVWRNNTGMLRNDRGDIVRYGLCQGSSDLIGIAPDGRFVAIEVKAPGKKARPEQEKFLNIVNKMGGIGLLVDDEKKLKNMLDAAGLKVQ